MILRLLFINSVLLLFMSSINAQLTLQQFKSINIGNTYHESKKEIKSYFLSNSKTLSNGIPGFYKIAIENSPFGSYGMGDYDFQFVKDTLVEASIEIEKLIYYRKDFYEILKKINEEILKNESLKPLEEYGKWNIDEPIKGIENIFKQSATQKSINQNDDISDVPFEYKDWLSYFSLYDGSIYTGNILIIQIAVGMTSRVIESKSNSKYSYSGGRCMVKFYLWGERFQDLIQMENNLNKPYTVLQKSKREINLEFKNGVYYLPIKINNVLNMNFVLDLGASDVSISPDLFLTLVKSGTIKESDYIGEKSYQFADGSTAKSSLFNISSLMIGEIEIKNVSASVSSNISSPLLLGQSALRKLGTYTIDNNRRILIIED